MRVSGVGSGVRWTAADSGSLAAVTAIAAVLRLFRLSRPFQLVFDETYYATDSCFYAKGMRACGLEAAPNEVHPPLAKWLMSIGIRIFGFDSFGYRIVAALAGIAAVALLYLLARRLLGSTLGATVAAGLLALDPLHFVQSRISMLDIFVVAFGIAAILCAVCDRDAILARRRGLRPLRAAAGAFAGAAAASKWSGAFFVVLVFVLEASWELSVRRRRMGLRAAIVSWIRQEGVGALVGLVVVPVVVYVATYAGRVEGALFSLPWSEGSWFRGVWTQQVSMASFHFGLEATHPYQSPAWSWILVKRPVTYFYETTAGGDSRVIMAVGNVIVWWSSIVALLYTAYRWLRSRDPAGPEGTIVAGLALTYGPWLVQGSDRGAVFLFYLLPSLPFMMLALAYVATVIADTWEGRIAIGLFAALAVAYFAYFYPVLAQAPVSYEDYRRRVLFERCRVFSEAQPEVPEGESPPPETGWCWI